MEPSPRWSAEDWSLHRRDAILGRRTRVVASCDSTQDLVSAWAAQDAPAGSLVIAHAQERGRGRRGRSWLAHEGGLYFSFLLRPHLAAEKMPRVPLLCAAALLVGLRELQVDAHVKWPNDLLCPAPAPGPLGPYRKVAGVLAEPWLLRNRIEAVICGVGINVHRPSAGFPPELADRAGSLWSDGEGLAPDPLLLHLLPHLERWLLAAASDAVFDECLAVLRLHSATLGRNVQAVEEGICGIAEDIDDDGALRIRAPTGQLHRIMAGDVLPAQTSP